MILMIFISFSNFVIFHHLFYDFKLNFMFNFEFLFLKKSRTHGIIFRSHTLGSFPRASVSFSPILREILANPEALFPSPSGQKHPLAQNLQ